MAVVERFSSVYIITEYLFMNENLCSNKFRVATLSLNKSVRDLLQEWKKKKELYPFSFENAKVSFRFCLPSTRIRWKRSPKTQTFENAFQSGNFDNGVFVFSCGHLKTELFENDDVKRSNSVHCGRTHTLQSTSSTFSYLVWFRA